MATSKSSGGSRWFMGLSLVAMLAALIIVGLQMRKPASTQPANTSPETTSAPAEPAPAAPDAVPRGIAGNG
jgi:cytoskeletal protein RodZ